MSSSIPPLNVPPRADPPDVTVNQVREREGMKIKYVLGIAFICAVLGYVGRGVYEDIKFESELLSFEARIKELKAEENEIEKKITNFDIEKYASESDVFITIDNHKSLLDEAKADAAFWKGKSSKVVAPEVVVLPAKGNIPVEKCRAYSKFSNEAEFKQWFKDRKEFWGVDEWSDLF